MDRKSKTKSSYADFKLSNLARTKSTTNSSSKKYYSKLSSTLIRTNHHNDKRKRLMKVIIATAQAAAVSDNDSSNQHSNLLFNNLVRIKRFHHHNNHIKNNNLNGHVTPSKNKTKNKTSFRIQKTYRFNRISRLRCIRMRQTQLKERRRNKKKSTSNQNNNNNNKKFKSSNVSSSCAESSDLNVSTSNQTNTTTSSISSSNSSNEDTLSLVECFNQTRFMNSSDTREDEDESKRKKPSTKKSSTKINCIRPRKVSFKKKLHRLGYLNLKKTQLFCDCHYCNYKPVAKTSTSSTEKLNNFYLKRKRLLKQDEIDAKKLKCDACVSPSLSSILSSGEENPDLIDSSIKSDDTNDESSTAAAVLAYDLKNKLKTSSRFKSVSETTTATSNSITAQSIDLKQCSSEDDLDDTGADDEQSDWPGNENSTKKAAKLNQLNDTGVKLVPWWDELDEVKSEQLLKSSKHQASHERENNEESDNSEFDQLLAGALNVMSASSRKAYKMVLDHFVFFLYFIPCLINFEINLIKK